MWRIARYETQEMLSLIVFCWEKKQVDEGYIDHHFFYRTNGAQQRKKDLREKKKTRFLKQNKTSATSFFLTYYFG